MNINKKELLTIFFIIGIILNVFSQDTITLYLDNNFASTEINDAKFIRKVVIKNNHYYVTDSDITGKMVNYGEYKSVNPWIEDGLSVHYDGEGNKYSSGYYKDGNLTGHWNYYINGKIDSVNYSIDLREFYTVDCKKLNTVKKKKKLKQIGTIYADSITSFIKKNFHLPARTKSEIKNFYQVINLVIDTDGRVKCPRIVNFISDDLSLELFRILLQYHSEIEVPFPIPLSLTFDIKKDKTKKDNDIFTIVEIMPRFTYKNCNNTLACIEQFISDSLRIPNNTCSGRVIVNLVIEPDGSISNMQILKGIDNCDGYVEEIERMLRTMPAWIPGKQGGKAVRVRQNITVNFKNK